MQISKRTLKIAGIVVAAVVVILIALPLFINVNSFRPKIESEVTNALGRPVTLGDLSLSLFSGKVGVENVSIADDPAFSKSPFITAKSLEVGVELMPLIFSKQLNVTGIVLDEPQITLLKAPTEPGTFPASAGPVRTTPLNQQSRARPRTFRLPSWRSKMESWRSAMPTPLRSRRFTTS